MKAISLLQPYASLVLAGLKPFETRTWPTDYRGDILIVSSKGHIDVNMRSERVLSKVLKANRRKIQEFTDGPKGVMLCVAKLVRIRRMQPQDAYKACIQFPIMGNIKYVWQLEDIRPVVQKPVKGALRLFEVPDSKIEYINCCKQCLKQLPEPQCFCDERCLGKYDSIINESYELQLKLF